MLIKGIKTGRKIPLRDTVGMILHSFEVKDGGYERVVELAEDRAEMWAVEFKQLLWEPTEAYAAGFIEGYLMAKMENEE